MQILSPSQRPILNRRSSLAEVSAAPVTSLLDRIQVQDLPLNENKS